MNNITIEQLAERYCNLFPLDSLTEEEIVRIEIMLDIKLPNDFKAISKIYSGGLMGLHSIYTFNPDSGTNYDIVNRTLFYRNNSLHLPHRFIALKESEVSFIVMETQSDANIDTRIIECSIEDAYNLAEEKPLLYGPVIYKNFTEFFQFLIEEEEKERRENP
jgi:SMI1-KNR4 cell-wall